jgi:hypothetical protein
MRSSVANPIMHFSLSAELNFPKRTTLKMPALLNGFG